MPRLNKGKSLLEMLLDFKIIDFQQVNILASDAAVENNLAARDFNIIKYLLDNKICSLEEIKVILIVQQLDRIELLAELATNLIEKKQPDESDRVNFFAFENFDYNLGRELKLLLFTDNHSNDRAPIDQFYRVARGVKNIFKKWFELSLNKVEAKDHLLSSYLTLHNSVISYVKVKLIFFVSGTKVLRPFIVEIIRQEAMVFILEKSYGGVERLYSGFIGNTAKPILSLLKESNNDSTYDNALGAIQRESLMIHGAPTPSPRDSPRSNSASSIVRLGSPRPS